MMNAPTRFFITAAFLFPLFVAPQFLLSQLRADAAIPAALPASATDGVRTENESQEVSIKALQQEKQGPVYKLRGQVEIDYGIYVFHADTMEYNSDTGQVTAEGHVVLDGGPGDEHVEASRAEYNINSEVGRFEHVHGSAGMRVKNRRMLLTSSSPFLFSGEVVEKTGPNHYVVFHGTITTCREPRPKWEFQAGKVTVDAGGYATIYNSSFRLEGIPVLYLPFVTYPVERQMRKSGFLMPQIGTSSIKGTILGDSYYWAISRSMDATLGAAYYSRRGWAPQLDFRARPNEKSFLDLSVFSVFDRGIGSPPVKQGGEDAKLDGETTYHGYRGVVDADYLSSYVFRLGFYDVFAQAVNSEVTSRAFLSKTTDGFSYNAVAERYQNFEGTTVGDAISILHTPEFEASSVDRQIAKWPLYWAFDTAIGGLSRSDPTFSTAPLLGRFDFHPSLTLPVMLRGWSLRPELALQETVYTQQLQPNSTFGIAIDNPISRQALETSVEVRPPAVSRVFAREWFGRKWKHVVEPRIAYNYVTGVNDFSHILRFDDRDILSDTNEVEYAVVNRIYAKRVAGASDGCNASESVQQNHEGAGNGSAEEESPPVNFPGAGSDSQFSVPWENRAAVPAVCSAEPSVREVITWELEQKYFLDPTFGGALIPGRRNVFTTSADLTGIAFLMSPRHLSPLISRLRVQTTSRTDAEWDLDYDFTSSKINASTALLNYRFNKFTVGGGDALLLVPGETAVVNAIPGPPRFNQFRLLLAYGSTNKRGFSGAANVGFDANLNFLQYAALQTAYNWDCCGVNIEYRRFALGSVRNENQYRFTFALTNIGAFGNLKREERLF